MSRISEKELFIETERLKILVVNLATGMSSTIINSLILTAIIWPFVPKDILLVWLVLNQSFVVLRYVMVGIFKRSRVEENLGLWKMIIAISFVIAGCLMSSSSILFLPYVGFEYMVFIYFILGGMVAGSVGSFHHNLLMFNAYSLSVFTLPTLAILQIDVSVTAPMVIMGLIFFIISSINAGRLNQDLKKYLSMKYDNNKLIDQTAALNMELIDKNRELEELSLIDPLTKLKNRRYLYEIFVEEVAQSIEDIWRIKKGEERRKKLTTRGYGILLIDIDYFKVVNDKYGHLSGDMVLEQFAERLREMVRNDDIISRIGGEEFVVVFRNIARDEVKTFSEKIRKHIEKSDFELSGGGSINLTCTVGAINYPFFCDVKESMNFDQAIFLADKALYYGKNNGRNQCVLVSSDYMESCDMAQTEEIVSDLNKSIEEEKISFSVIS